MATHNTTKIIDCVKRLLEDNFRPSNKLQGYITRKLLRILINHLGVGLCLAVKDIIMKTKVNHYHILFL